MLIQALRSLNLIVLKRKRNWLHSSKCFLGVGRFRPRWCSRVTKKTKFFTALFLSGILLNINREREMCMAKKAAETSWREYRVFSWFLLIKFSRRVWGYLAVFWDLAIKAKKIRRQQIGFGCTRVWKVRKICKKKSSNERLIAGFVLTSVTSLNGFQWWKMFSLDRENAFQHTFLSWFWSKHCANDCCLVKSLSPAIWNVKQLKWKRISC